jgi:hypothetical protein
MSPATFLVPADRRPPAGDHGHSGGLEAAVADWIRTVIAARVPAA